MTFIPVVPPQVSPELVARVRNLEAALAKSMNLFQLLADKLESRLGPDFLGPELSQMQNIGRDTDQQIAQIDQLIKEHKQPAAARVLREMSGATWDEALQITNRWSTIRREQKARWLQFHQWTHMLLHLEGQSEIPDNGESKDSV